MEAKAIQTDRYMNEEEIKKHLENVEYIVLAAPAPPVFKETPIQFTIFLNTSENSPPEIQKEVLQKFLTENSIGQPEKLMSKIMPVGFGISTAQDTPMPLLLIDPKDQRSIPYIPIFVMDFLADSDAYSEVKEVALTGWSYSYN